MQGMVGLYTHDDGVWLTEFQYDQRVPRVEPKSERLHPSKQAAVLRAVSDLRPGSAVRNVRVFDNYPSEGQLDSRTVDAHFANGEMLRIGLFPSSRIKGRATVVLFGGDEQPVWEASNGYEGQWAGIDYRPAGMTELKDLAIVSSARRTAVALESILSGDWAQPLRRANLVPAP
ncbi:MAG: hypothetical protein QOF14_1642 [Hyphomicrobiales bacterium]|jgi:hypothetical protein|nr:hypothetical protein [Hyphomicrobiales bacterium]